MLTPQRVCLGSNTKLVDDKAHNNPELTADETGDKDGEKIRQLCSMPSRDSPSGAKEVAAGPINPSADIYCAWLR